MGGIPESGGGLEHGISTRAEGGVRGVGADAQGEGSTGAVGGNHQAEDVHGRRRPYRHGFMVRGGKRETKNRGGIADGGFVDLGLQEAYPAAAAPW